MRIVKFRYVVLAIMAGAITIPRPQCIAGQEPQGEIDVQATTGEPLGVGKLVVRFAPGRRPALVRGQSPRLSDREGRIVYPVYRDATPRQPAEKQPPDSVTAYF